MTDKKKILDATDALIVELLRQNGRRTLDSIAEEIGISSTSVQKRLQSMLNAGVLDIYATVRIDMDESPVVAVTAMNVDHANIRSLVDELSKKPAFGTLTRTLGRFDLITTSMFKSLKELSTHVEQVLPSSPGIKSAETFICLSIFKGNYGRINPYLINSEDRDLIALLMKDGRQNNKSIAEKLNISPSSAGRRINQLINSGTIRINTVLYQARKRFFAVLFARAEHEKMADCARALAGHTEVLFLATVTGRYEIFATLEFDSEDQFSEFLEEKLATMDGIKEVEALFMMKSLWLYDSAFDKYWAESHPQGRRASGNQ